MLQILGAPLLKAGLVGIPAALGTVGLIDWWNKQEGVVKERLLNEAVPDPKTGLPVFDNSTVGLYDRFWVKEQELPDEWVTRRLAEYNRTNPIILDALQFPDIRQPTKEDVGTIEQYLARTAPLVAEAKGEKARQRGIQQTTDAFTLMSENPLFKSQLETSRAANRLKERQVTAEINQQNIANRIALADHEQGWFDRQRQDRIAAETARGNLELQKLQLDLTRQGQENRMAFFAKQIENQQKLKQQAMLSATVNASLMTLAPLLNRIA